MSQISNFVTSGQVAFFAYPEADLAEFPGYLGESVFPQSISQGFGTPTPQYIPDPAVPGNMLIVGYTYTQPELAQAQINQRWVRPAITYLEQCRRKRCGQTWIIKADACNRPDTLSVWESVLVIEGLQMTNMEISDIKSDTEDTTVGMSGQFSATDFYFIFTARFSERADSIVLAEVLDIMYADAVSCGSCAQISDGTQKIYALTGLNTGSPGLSPQVAYATDGGSTWATKDIPTLGAKSANRMSAVGQYIVVVSEADGAHHYIPKSSIASSSWTRVNTGYVATKSPRAIYAASGNRIFMGAAGGYIYMARNITTQVEVVEDGSNTTQNCNDVHGQGTSIIVAAHNSNVLQFSTNGGNSFQLVTTSAGLNGPEAGANITRVWVKNSYVWYVGTNTGKLWYTTDRGYTWTQRNLPNQSSISVINDIKFTPGRSEHGVLACEVGGVGKVYRTISGGRDWYDSDPAVAGIPTATRYNAVALADVYAIAAGGKNVANDGVVAIAEATE